jgi:hypothetical protein
MALIALRSSESGSAPSTARFAVIVAPGPSAIAADLYSIGECVGQGSVDTIAVSGAFLMDSYRDLHARQHVIAASHPPITTEQWTAWFTQLMATVEGNVRVPTVDRRLVDGAGFGNDQRVQYYSPVKRHVHRRVPKTSHRSLRIALMGQSVATTALSLVLTEGYERIGLYGFDHDWILNLGVTRHSYAEGDNPLVKHGYNEWSDESRLDDECRSYVKLWADYRHLSRQAAQVGTQIVNVSRNSLLDLFPRESLERFLQNSRPES